MADALAVFVKTPGLSQVKTRLARDIGQSAAETFYRLSCNAIQDLMTAWVKEGGVSFWAVAEAPHSLHAMWLEFPCVPQGEGDLGARLHTVYSRLLREHRNVFLIGADSPQLTLHELLTAHAALTRNDFVFGPARDGGFYLLGGRKPIAMSAWQSVAYSAPDTQASLAKELAALGSIVTLESCLTDVDTASDLTALRQEIKSALSPAQSSLVDWLEHQR